MSTNDAGSAYRREPTVGGRSSGRPLDTSGLGPVGVALRGTWAAAGVALTASASAF
ncbi:hypothetical protein ABZ749_07535 [Micromonospora sp. NPDC047753]|uniref:hypothetical protein n=1 Tax=Micromonospora sp. NPDC047753 TaxID=3154817 RepID=UPI0034062B74